MNLPFLIKKTGLHVKVKAGKSGGELLNLNDEL